MVMGRLDIIDSAEQNLYGLSAHMPQLVWGSKYLFQIRKFFFFIFTTFSGKNTGISCWYAYLYRGTHNKGISYI